VSAVLPPARDALRARWVALGQRERQLIVVAGVLIGVLLLWMAALRPAWQTLRDAPAQLDRLDAQVAQMTRLAAESQALRGAPVIPLAQAAAALKAATDRLGEHAKLQVLGDRATLTLVNATPEQLRRWLADARSGAHARPVEATLTRATVGYSGTLVVVMPSGGAP
jgi:general secretion pathway protein M